MSLNFLKVRINTLFMIALIGCGSILIGCEKETIIDNRADGNDRVQNDSTNNAFWLTPDVKKYIGTNIFLDSVLISGHVYQDPEWEFLKQDTSTQEYWVKLTNDSVFVGMKDFIDPSDTIVSMMHAFKIIDQDADGWYRSNNGSSYKFVGDTIYREYLYTYNSRYDNKTHKVIHHYKGIKY